jgi:hypothetical protein
MKPTPGQQITLCIGVVLGPLGLLRTVGVAPPARFAFWLAFIGLALLVPALLLKTLGHPPYLAEGGSPRAAHRVLLLLVLLPLGLVERQLHDARRGVLPVVFHRYLQSQLRAFLIVGPLQVRQGNVLL